MFNSSADSHGRLGTGGGLGDDGDLGDVGGLDGVFGRASGRARGDGTGAHCLLTD